MAHATTTNKESDEQAQHQEGRGWQMQSASNYICLQGKEAQRVTDEEQIEQLKEGKAVELTQAISYDRAIQTCVQQEVKEHLAKINAKPQTGWKDTSLDITQLGMQVIELQTIVRRHGVQGSSESDQKTDHTESKGRGM
ncbi:MAG: hypothetical protein ACI9CD_000361 [Candidatus Deianiraeaceae bacterium]